MTLAGASSEICGVNTWWYISRIYKFMKMIYFIIEIKQIRLRFFRKSVSTLIQLKSSSSAHFRMLF